MKPLTFWISARLLIWPAALTECFALTLWSTCLTHFSSASISFTLPGPEDTSTLQPYSSGRIIPLQRTISGSRRQAFGSVLQIHEISWRIRLLCYGVIGALMEEEWPYWRNEF